MPNLDQIARDVDERNACGRGCHLLRCTQWRERVHPAPATTRTSFAGSLGRPLVPGAQAPSPPMAWTGHEERTSSASSSSSELEGCRWTNEEPLSALRENRAGAIVWHCSQ